MCLTQAPVDEAGAPLIVVVIVIRNNQARVFDVVAAAGLVFSAEILGAVPLVIAELGESNAQDIVARVRRQFEFREILIPHRCHIGLGEGVFRVVIDPVPDADIIPVRFQCRSGQGSRSRQQEKRQAQRKKPCTRSF